MIESVSSELAKWRAENPNDWCALDPETYEVIDRDKRLVNLSMRVNKDHVIFCTNWYRPRPKV